MFTFTVLEFGGGNEKFFINTSINLAKNKNTDITIITMDEDHVLKLQRILSIYYGVKIENKFIRNEDSERIIKTLGNVRYIKVKSFSELRQLISTFDVIYAKGEILELTILKFLVGYKKINKLVICCETALVYGLVESIHSYIHNYLYSSFVFKFLCSGVSAFQVLNAADESLIKILFPKKKVIKLFNPLNHSDFSSLEKDHKIEIKNRDINKKYILWAGRFDEQKGVFDLFKLINDVNKKNADKVHWLICGFGVYENEVKEIVANTVNVTYFGRVEYNYMPSMYLNSDLFLTTSRWEGSPFVIIESFAMGTPVISYDVSGCSDLIRVNENGIIARDYKDLEVKISNFINGMYVFDRKMITNKFFEDNSSDQIYNKIYKLLCSK